MEEEDLIRAINSGITNGDSSEWKKLEKKFKKINKEIVSITSSTNDPKTLCQKVVEFNIKNPRNLPLPFFLKGFLLNIIKSMENPPKKSSSSFMLTCSMNDIVDKMSSPDLCRMINIYKNFFEDNRLQDATLFEIWRKVLEEVTLIEKVIEKKNSDKLIRGIELKSNHIKSICKYEWNMDTIKGVCVIFKELPLNNSDVEIIVNKIFRRLSNYKNVENLADKVRDLLLMKNSVQKEMIFLKSVDLYHEIQEKCGIEDGKIWMNLLIKALGEFTFLFKFSRVVGNMYLRLFKRKQLKISVFTVLLLFLIPVVDDVHDKKVFKMLEVLMNEEKDHKKRNKERIFWKDILPSSEDRSICEILKTDITILLRDFKDNESSSVLLEKLTLKFVDFCFFMIEKNINEQTATYMLTELFSRKKEIQSFIFNSILTKMQIKSCTYYIKLLKVLMKIRAPNEVQPFKDVMCYLNYQKESTQAIGLLKAIKPLFERDSSLVNFVSIVLKKLLFSKKIVDRTIGVNGFLFLLKLKKAGSSSNASDKERTDDYNTLYSLRRCLSHQYEIRKDLYKGICLVKTNDLRKDIITILTQHLREYSSSSQCLDLDKCINENKLIVSEPIHELILTLSRIYHDGSDDEKENNRVLKDLHKFLRKIMNELIEENFYFVKKETNFKTKDVEGKTNCLKAIVAFGVYVSFMEFSIFNLPNEVGMEKFEKIMKHYVELHKYSMTAVKKLKQSKNKIPSLSFDFGLKFLKEYIKNVEDSKIIEFVIAHTKDNLSVLMEMSLNNVEVIEEYTSKLITLGRLLFKQMRKEKVKEEGKRVKKLLCDSIMLCFNILQHQSEQEKSQDNRNLINFLKEVFFKKLDVDSTEKLFLAFTKNIRESLEDDEEDTEFFTCELYTKMMLKILKIVNHGEAKAYRESVESIAKEFRVTKLSFVKLWMTLVCEVQFFSSKKNKIYVIADDLVLVVRHFEKDSMDDDYEIDDDDTEEEEEKELSYEMLDNISLYKSMYDLVLKYCEKVLLDVEWKSSIILKHKSKQMLMKKREVLNFSQDDGKMYGRDLLKSLHKRTHSMVYLIVRLIKSIPKYVSTLKEEIKQPLDTLKIYKLLHLVYKIAYFFSDFYVKNSDEDFTNYFQKLTEICTHNLKQQINVLVQKKKVFGKVFKRVKNTERREASLIPLIIEKIELFENSMLNLSVERKTNLMKRTVSLNLLKIDVNLKSKKKKNKKKRKRKKKRKKKKKKKKSKDSDDSDSLSDDSEESEVDDEEESEGEEEESEGEEDNDDMSPQRKKQKANGNNVNVQSDLINSQEF